MQLERQVQFTAIIHNITRKLLMIENKMETFNDLSDSDVRVLILAKRFLEEAFGQQDHQNRPFHFHRRNDDGSSINPFGFFSRQSHVPYFVGNDEEQIEDSEDCKMDEQTDQKWKNCISNITFRYEALRTKIEEERNYTIEVES
jgi:hypothetical protein